MLQVVPAVGAQSEVVDRGHVPDPGGGNIERQVPARVRQPFTEEAQRRRAKQGRGPVRADLPRQAAQEREQRRPEPQERRRHHHEQQVLHHVDLQQERGERLDGRRQRHEDRGQPAEEGEETSRGPALKIAAVQDEPAANVDRSGDGERGQDPGVERPGAQKGVERGAHGSFFATGWSVASRAGA